MRSTADGITQKQECSSSAVLWEGREKCRDWELRVSILWLSYLVTSEKVFGLCCVILWLLSTYLKLQLFSCTAFSHSRKRIKNEYGQGLKVAWLCNGQWQKSRYSFWQKDCLPPLHFQRLKSRNHLFCCLQSKNRFCLLSLKLFVTVCTLFWFFAMVIILLSPKCCAIISNAAIAPGESSDHQSQTPLLLESTHIYYSCPIQCLVL